MSNRLPSLAALAGGALVLGACTVEDLFTTSGLPATTGDKVALGLRKALEVGIDSSAAAATRLNGYLAHKVIKILLPEEAEQALDAAGQVAAYVKPFHEELKLMQSLVNLTTGTDKSAFTANLVKANALLIDAASLESIGDSVVKYMNRGAERAAPRSVPIFKQAVTGMTIDDGLSLLNSPDSTAATGYLKGRTFTPLVSAYSPIVDSTLALVPLTQYWSGFRTAYNSILADYKSLLAFQASWNSNTVVAALPALQVDVLRPVAYENIQTESLGAWTTDKALVGLFWLVGEEEKEIRHDPLAYVRDLAAEVSDLLKEVFGEIMDMKK